MYSSSLSARSSNNLEKDPESQKETSTHSRSSSYNESERKLKLFESPLAHERKTSTAGVLPPQPTFVNISGPVGLVAPYHVREKEDNFQDKAYVSQNDRLNEVQMRETPVFRRYEEATNLELFYDLFFVANLTTFTDSHEINQVTALKAYAGFFCILWFLWLQVSLFDVRFGQDSILERIGKACQFGVMVRLAMVGADFEPSQQTHHVFRSLALVLAVSRLVLAFQYSIVLREVWHYKDSKVPLSLLVGSNFVATGVYFGTSFAFKPEHPHSKVFIVWYVTAVLETAFNIAVTSKWEVLSFSGTHLIKRMSLLTLIILGEGVIALSKSIATISKRGEDTDFPLLVTIFSAVVIIYFIYMLYFDRINYNHFGSKREGLWTFIHFPFHLALVLLMEGGAQFILWRKASEVLKITNETLLTAQASFNGTTSAAFATLYTSLITPIFSTFSKDLKADAFDEGKEIITKIANAIFRSEEQVQETNKLFALIQETIFENFGIESPEKGGEMMEMEMSEMMMLDPTEQLRNSMEAFKLIFTYFFVASGVTIILLNILTFISHPSRSKSSKIRACLSISLGVMLAGLATLVESEAGMRFAQSAFILPTVGVVFVLVLGLQYTDLWWS